MSFDRRSFRYLGDTGTSSGVSATPLGAILNAPVVARQEQILLAANEAARQSAASPAVVAPLAPVPSPPPWSASPLAAAPPVGPFDFLTAPITLAGITVPTWGLVVGAVAAWRLWLR